ncbi:MAG: PBP1A family penicillin-binding protein, partial [Hyphomicrobiales bacterium]
KAAAKGVVASKSTGTSKKPADTKKSSARKTTKATPGAKRKSARSAARRKSSRKSAKARRGHGRGILLGLGSLFLTLSIIGFVAVSGLIFFYTYDMPNIDTMRIPKRAPSITIVSAGGEIMGRRGVVHAGRIGFDELPKQLIQAVLAIEDRRFFDHIGIDFLGLARAAITNFKAGRIVQGGSTLTQQLAKNLFLKPERKIRRKVQEMILALRLEGSFSKRQILEIYLNRVYFGAGTFGVEAAAERYFGKSVRDVSLSEAAMLAGLLKAPTRFSPAAHKERAIKRATLVLKNMLEAGFISEDERRAAELTLQIPRARTGIETASYVLDWVTEQAGELVPDAQGDLVIETTIDTELQAFAEETARKFIEEKGIERKASQATVVIMDNKGAVKALVGGLSYEESQFNRPVKALRQPGSSFKPFVYLAGLEAGITPWDIRIDEPIDINGWRPRNYSKKYRGPVKIFEALGKSINTIAAQVAFEVGPSNVVAVAKRMGINSPLHTNPSIALGTGEVTLLELTSAYAPLSNGGFKAPPHAIARILSTEGQILYEAPTETQRVVSPAQIADMNFMLSGVVAWGTGGRARLARYPAAGKTGTTQDYRDAWFIGYTSQLTGGVWVGNDDNSEMKRVTGGNLPAMIWKAVMTRAQKGLKPRGLPMSTEPPPEPDYFISRAPSGSFFRDLFGLGPSRAERQRQRAQQQDQRYGSRYQYSGAAQAPTGYIDPSQPPRKLTQSGIIQPLAPPPPPLATTSTRRKVKTRVIF